MKFNAKLVEFKNKTFGIKIQPDGYEDYYYISLKNRNFIYNDDLKIIKEECQDSDRQFVEKKLKDYLDRERAYEQEEQQLIRDTTEK